MIGTIPLEETPVVHLARMRAGYEDVRRSWRRAPLDLGTVPEIFGLLEADLEHDAMLIHSGGSGGVVVYDQRLGVLEDNDITGNARAGVEIITGGNPTVLANTISRNGGSAIRIYDEGRATASEIACRETLGVHGVFPPSVNLTWSERTMKINTGLAGPGGRQSL